jgi:hypothetical protein
LLAAPGQVRFATDVSFGVEPSMTIPHGDAIIETPQVWRSVGLAESADARTIPTIQPSR